MCPEIMDVWEDLANIPELHIDYQIGHVLCPKAHETCYRLGIKGFPTLSVLDGNHIYDYQGKLSVRHLAKFVNDK